MTLNVFSNLKDSMSLITDRVYAGYMNLMWILMRVGFLFLCILQCMWTSFTILTSLKNSRLVLFKDSFHLLNSNWICTGLRSPFSSQLTVLPMGQQLGLNSSPACEHFPPIYNSQISQNQTTPNTLTQRPGSGNMCTKLWPLEYFLVVEFSLLKIREGALSLSEKISL